VSEDQDEGVLLEVVEPRREANPQVCRIARWSNEVYVRWAILAFD
jgi:hypothetical protein